MFPPKNYAFDMNQMLSPSFPCYCQQFFSGHCSKTLSKVHNIHGLVCYHFIEEYICNFSTKAGSVTECMRGKSFQWSRTAIPQTPYSITRFLELSPPIFDVFLNDDNDIVKELILSYFEEMENMQELYFTVSLTEHV